MPVVIASRVDKRHTQPQKNKLFSRAPPPPPVTSHPLLPCSPPPLQVPRSLHKWPQMLIFLQGASAAPRRCHLQRTLLGAPGLVKCGSSKEVKSATGATLGIEVYVSHASHSRCILIVLWKIFSYYQGMLWGVLKQICSQCATVSLHGTGTVSRGAYITHTAQQVELQHIQVLPSKVPSILILGRA